MTQQMERRYKVIWWKQWELTCSNSLLTPCIKNVSVTLAVQDYIQTY